MSSFDEAQHKVLLSPLNTARIENRSQAGMKLSYLSQQDVRAHAIRLFGFGGFDCETLDTRLMFEELMETKRWNVGYLVTMRITIRNPQGELVCVYSESAVGSSTQPQRGEAHDMALKTASSDAMKRCFINLGSQFGLSLYDNGSTAEIVKKTLVSNPDPVADPPAEQPVEVVNEQTGEIISDSPFIASELVNDLRAIATQTDSRARVKAVASIKSHLNEEELNTLVTVGDQQLSISRLADNVAAGVYVKKDS
jgi:hypothetical protein